MFEVTGMRKSHAPGVSSNLTACGYECTMIEYSKMRGRKAADVDCRHCIRALEKVRA